MLVGSILVEASLIKWAHDQNLKTILEIGLNLLSIVPKSSWRHQMQTFCQILRIMIHRAMLKEQESRAPRTTQNYIIQTSRWPNLITLKTLINPNIIMLVRERITLSPLIVRNKWEINSGIILWHSNLQTLTNFPITIRPQLSHLQCKKLHHLLPARKSVKGP